MPGQTTRRALELLYSEIDESIGSFKQKIDASTSFIGILKESHRLLIFKWLGYFLMLVIAVTMAFLDHYVFTALVILCVLLHVTGGIHVAVQVKYELHSHLQLVLEKLRMLQDTKFEYESLWQPMSPCISLQWVYRDGKLVNCPLQLLVKGDVIKMRPGHEAPGKCQSLDRKLTLNRGDKYTIANKNIVGTIDACHALVDGSPARDFLMLETPYISYLSICLQRALDPYKPNNFTRQQKTIMSNLRRYLVPLFGCSSIVVYACHCCNSTKFDFLYMMLTMTPVVFLLACPIFWFIQYALGTAKIIYYADEFAGITERDIEKMHNVPWFKVIKKALSEKSRFWHSGMFLESFASANNLCCVDKKGILSWPNAIPEKVFFLKQMVAEAENDTEEQNTALSLTKAEVLDLTPRGPANSVMFDDPKWTLFLNNLKPLGLGILLNNCDEKTHEKYAAFFDHLSYESQNKETWVPVINKRCLCDLSAEMGFTDEAISNYDEIQHLYMFRNEEFDSAFRANDINIARLKMPFPNFCSAITQDKVTNGLQMFSQGTADLILEHCTDYWNGHNICPLTDSDRKCILDFYQRTSLTAYCTAFSYAPLESCANIMVPHNTYIQIPSQSLISSTKGTLGDFSAVSYANLEEVVHNIENCSKTFHNRMCKQVFIGMVTLQYLARPNFVRLIEELEKACIRFVHFSKENELRSRGFSEKMGLESGWNCHISLLNENNQDIEESSFIRRPVKVNMKYGQATRCYSTPSVLTSTVESKSSPRSNFKLSLSPSPNDADNRSEVSAAVQFDIANRAKLPKGIENMRSHIENVDNVPLLVSLFTDCTTTATKEMLRIMQEYDQVLCVLGSSRNIDNLSLFVQADCSISWTPQSPRMCTRAVGKNHEELLEVVNALNSVPCVLRAKTNDELMIFQLVNEARHFVSQMQSSFQFVVLCSVTLSLLNLVYHIFRLPLPITPLGLLFLLAIVIPLIGFTLVCSPTDKDIMSAPNVDILNVNYNTRVFCFLSYFFKASFIVFTVLLCKAVSILRHCDGYQCDPESILAKLRLHDIETLQLFNMLVLCVHFVTISASGLNRKKLVWQHNPLQNTQWILAILCVVTISVVVLLSWADLHEISVPSWIIFAVSPIFLLALSEGCKHHELKMIRRQEKRLRLHFMTKLGMNSPF